MENQNVVVTPQVAFADIQTALDKARSAIVNNGKQTGELIKNYARALEGAFNMTLANGDVVKWFAVTGQHKKLVTAEYKKFEAQLVEAGLEKSKYVYWQRVKEESGYQTTGNKVKSNASLDDKNKTELATIINRIVASMNGGEESKSSEIIEDLRYCFTHLGGDLTAKGMK
jgi:F0F1-type ATP synthase alpha subunit